MSRPIRNRIVALLFFALLVPGRTFGEGVIKLNYVQSIYSDGGGRALRHPEDVACLKDGRLLVADTENGRLLLYAFQGGEPAATPEKILDPRITYPVKVGSNTAGDLFVLDGKQRKMFRVRTESGLVEEVVPADLPSGNPPAIKSFVLDAHDSIYLLDVANGCVWVLDKDGAYDRKISFPSPRGFMSDVDVDAQGNVFLLDSVNARVFSAAPHSSGFLPVTASLKERVRFPTSIVAGPDGRIYVLDRNGGRLLILRRDGSFIGRQSGVGWKEGRLNYPAGMCIDDRGTLFIADTNNNRVQIFSIAR